MHGSSVARQLKAESFNVINTGMIDFRHRARSEQP
jgi:hypothetical protein